jgi:hypothetical protein
VSQKAIVVVIVGAEKGVGWWTKNGWLGRSKCVVGNEALGRGIDKWWVMQESADVSLGI